MELPHCYACCQWTRDGCNNVIGENHERNMAEPSCKTTKCSSVSYRNTHAACTNLNWMHSALESFTYILKTGDLSMAHDIISIIWCPGLDSPVRLDTFDSH